MTASQTPAPANPGIAAALAPPRVLIVGGFATSPPLYGPMADRLRSRGAAHVTIAPVWLPDWMLAAGLGFGPLGRRVARTIADAWRRGGKVPLLVVGHSAGGILARLATSPEPFEGYGTGVARAVGALVTLGTPHVMLPPGDAGDAAVQAAGEAEEPAGRWWRGRAGVAAAQFLDRTVPGAAFAPATGYLTVASRAIPAAAEPGAHVPLRHRFAGHFYEGILGSVGRAARGDGLIPVASAHLAGARQMTLDGVVHGQLGGGPWYGSAGAIDGWWPAALEVWAAALEARAAGAVPGMLRGADVAATRPPES